jgi:hypothetical protein
MRGKKIAVAVVSVFMLLSVVQVASAISDFTPDALEGYCNENGGTYFPPGTGGAYCCLLSDKLICCGGSIPICTQSLKTPGGQMSISESLILSMQTSIVTKLNDITVQLNNLQTICSGNTGTIF